MVPALIVQWPEDMDNYVFASNTSLITKQQIEYRLFEEPHGLDEIIDESAENKKNLVTVDREKDYDQ